jgi:hypothetical protein
VERPKPLEHPVTRTVRTAVRYAAVLGRRVRRVVERSATIVEPGSDELLLGKACLALGSARLLSSFFLLPRPSPATDPPTVARG